MSSRKLPPKWVGKTAPDPSPVEGVDNLPLPMGVNRKAVRDAETASEGTPGAMGVPMTGAGDRDCMGDNPKIADVAGFATGQDVRSYGSSPSSNPTPDKPGA
jgi:hypothetical protein